MLKDMKTQTHLNPGQKVVGRIKRSGSGEPGERRGCEWTTKRHAVEKHGAALLGGRYRYDEKRGVRLKTVEIVVEQKAWTPTLPYRDEEIVSVTAAFTEKAVRDKLKAAGGRWDPNEKVRRVVFGLIRGDTELERESIKD